MTLASTRPIVIFGASGHAKVVLDIVRRSGFSPIAVLDDDPSLWGKDLRSVPIVGGREALPRLMHQGVKYGLVAVGANRARLSIAEWLAESGLDFPCAVHPSAVVDASVFLGSGTVVMAGAVINADSVIGEHVIINTGASVDHDCCLGDGVHVAPGARLCGNVAVGAMTLVGVGASVIQGLTLGNNVVVGAGAAVVDDVSAATMVVGVPARALRWGM